MSDIFSIEIDSENVDKNIIKKEFEFEINKLSNINTIEDLQRGVITNLKWFISFVGAPKAVENLSNVLINMTKYGVVKIKKGDLSFTIKTHNQEDIPMIVSKICLIFNDNNINQK